MDTLNNTNWEEFQKLYNDGESETALMKRFKVSWHILKEAKSLNLFVPQSKSERSKLVHRIGKYGNYESYRTKEHRERSSKFGGLKQSSGRCKTYYYQSKNNGVVALQGSWEVHYAKFLDDSGVIWEKNYTRSFVYNFEGKDSKYFPDFYIPSEDLFVEVKGYKTARDEAKWQAFKGNLLIADKAWFVKQGINLGVQLEPSEKKPKTKPRKKINRKRFACGSCGEPTFKSGSCWTCYSQAIRAKSVRPSKEELVKMISEHNMTEVSRKLGLKSQTTLRKWCQQYGIDCVAVSPFSNRNRIPKVKKTRVTSSKYMFVMYRKDARRWVARKANIFHKLFREEEEAAAYVAQRLGSDNLILRKQYTVR